MIVPVLVIFDFVAVRVVDGCELLANLLSVRAGPPIDLVGADV
jgi:hypothetical protein